MKRNKIVIKFEIAIRGMLLYVTNDVLPQIVVTEFPKSGGSWFCQMLSSYLNIPFPRNKIPTSPKNILQGHYMYNPRLKNVICVVRDGRDVMVSFYYYSFFENEKYNSRLVQRCRKVFPFKDFHDIRSNLPQFIDFQMTKPLYPQFTWPQFIDSWFGQAVLFVRYEDLLTKPIETMLKVVRSLSVSTEDIDKLKKVVAEYSFSNQSGRNPGQENQKSFLRKGVAGDWENHFNREAREIFHHYAGKALLTVGYEKDTLWIEG